MCEGDFPFAHIRGKYEKNNINSTCVFDAYVFCYIC